MLIDREGRFRAYGKDFSVGETGSNKLTTVTIGFTLTEEWDGKQWTDCTDGDLGITGWFYIEKRNGDVNEFQVEQLKRAFGWDGRDVFWFEDTPLENLGIQLEVKSETYQGTERFKVGYIHAGDSDPEKRTKKSDEGTRRSVNSRLSMKLRAMAGSAPKPPEPPKPKVEQPPTLEDQAWEKFCSLLPAEWTDTERQAEWFRVIAFMFKKDRAALTDEDWVRMAAECGEHITPF